MANSTPKITVRGAARSKGIPSGYIVGRQSGGNGAPELIPLSNLQRRATQGLVHATKPTGVTPGTYGPASLTVGADGRLTAAANYVSGVTPGNYTNASITVDAAGVITLAANGTGGGTTSHFGTGAPSTLFNDGDLYFDRTSIPYQGYVQDPLGGSPIRGGTSIASNVGSSINIAFPAGAAVGDQAFIGMGGGWVPSLPSGWTQLDSQNGSNWNGMLAMKTLSSGDISTGHVTVSFSGGFDMYGACIVVPAANYAGAVRSTTAVRNGSSATTQTVTSPSGVVASDVELFFGSQRAAANMTVTPGTQLGQSTTGSAGAGVVNDDTNLTGTASAVFAMPGGNSGYYVGVVVIETNGLSGSGWVKML